MKIHKIRNLKSKIMVKFCFTDLLLQGFFNHFYFYLFLYDVIMASLICHDVVSSYGSVNTFNDSLSSYGFVNTYNPAPKMIQVLCLSF